MEIFAKQYLLIQPTHNRKDIKERKQISIKSLKSTFNKNIPTASHFDKGLHPSRSRLGLPSRTLSAVVTL